MTKRKSSTRKQYVLLVLIAVSSLFLSLAALEGLLALGGKALVAYRNQDLKHLSSRRQDKDQVNILTLGDSFTFGGGGVVSDSYPSQLDRMISRKYPKLVNITNHGVCESTSKDVLNNISSLVAFSHPDIVIILSGAANLYDPYPFADELMTARDRYESSFRKLHVYKLMRYVVTELAARIDRVSARAISRGTASLPGIEVKEAIGNVAKMSIPEARSELKGLAASGDPMRELRRGSLLAKLGFIDEASPVLISAIDRLDESVHGLFCRDCITQVLRQGEEQQKSEGTWTPFKGEQISLLQLKCGAGVGEGSKGTVEYLLKMYMTQSILDPKNGVAAIDDLLKRKPEWSRNRRLEAARIAFENMGLWRQNIGVWYKDNLEKIHAELKGKRIRLVLATYPVSYEPINSIAREFAAEHDLILVDHEKTFAPLIAKQWSKYFVDDTHCTDAGHELMAKNLFQAIEPMLKDPEPLKKHFWKGAPLTRR